MISKLFCKLTLPNIPYIDFLSFVILETSATQVSEKVKPKPKDLAPLSWKVGVA